jgi:hypothetical protein
MKPLVFVVGIAPSEMPEPWQAAAAEFVHLTPAEALQALSEGAVFDVMVWSSPLDQAGLRELVRRMAAGRDGSPRSPALRCNREPMPLPSGGAHPIEHA